MGSPSFAKPEFVSAIAVMNDFDVSDEAVRDYRITHELSEDDYTDSEIVGFIYEDEGIYVREQSEEVLEKLHEIKSIVDSELESIAPEVEFEGINSWVSDWFDIERVYAYNGDGVGFELSYGMYTPYPRHDKNETLASLFWEYVDQEQAEEFGVTFEDVEEFFDILVEAYDYMMLAVGYELHTHEINGGWCSNTSKITEKPMPSQALKNTSIVKRLDERLHRLTAVETATA